MPEQMYSIIQDETTKRDEELRMRLREVEEREEIWREEKAEVRLFFSQKQRI